MTKSVLDEADPRSLDDLFNLDPLELANDPNAIERIVGELRLQRKDWAVVEKEKVTKGKKKKVVANPNAPKLSLDDLLAGVK